MCPISGLVQFFIVTVVLLLLCQAYVVHSLKILFERKNITLTMDYTQPINYTIEGDPPEAFNTLKLYTENPHIATIQKEYTIVPDSFPYYGTFNLTGVFLGDTRIVCKTNDGKPIDDPLKVIVVRKKRVIDTIFTASVAIFVSIIYINFGCALNWKELRTSLRRPIGPVIGFVGQFVLMPILSYGLGRLFFPNSHEMQLGMFFTGVSPAGGASNVWTAVLDGNIDLSITMTTISTFAAFAMMPLWIFTLGRLIFDDANLGVPYEHISMYAIGLVLPLAVGFLISRYCNRLAQFLVRILKGFSSLLILFIVIFAIVTNLYLFKLFSWQIVVTGMGLPYLGYIIAYLVARALKQPQADCLAIAIETGIQNTGIAIFLLRFALPQPQADLTTVAPVSVAIMTPLPLASILIYRKIRERISTTHKKILVANGNQCDLQSLDKTKTEEQLISTIT